MKRTQIYLPSTLHQELSQEAKKRQITMSELIRRRIARQDHFRTQKMSRKAAFQKLDAVARKLTWRGVPKDLSDTIDETLYG